MGSGLTPATGTFAIRDHLGIPIRFFLYNDANVFSHRNTSLATMHLFWWFGLLFDHLFSG
jgi:hypothetical protein